MRVNYYLNELALDFNKTIIEFLKTKKEQLGFLIGKHIVSKSSFLKTEWIYNGQCTNIDILFKPFESDVNLNKLLDYAFEVVVELNKDTSIVINKNITSKDLEFFEDKESALLFCEVQNGF